MGWDGIIKRGEISALDSNQYMCRCIQNSHEVCWFTRFWKIKIPIKIILFIWLAWKNKNLTWENRRKRNMQGANDMCFLQARGRKKFTYYISVPGGCPDLA